MNDHITHSPSTLSTLNAVFDFEYLGKYSVPIEYSAWNRQLYILEDLW